MKKILYYSLLIALCHFLTGCAEKAEESMPGGRTLTVSAIFDDGSSRATVQDGGVAVYWEPGDEIKVFFGQASGKLISTNVEDSPTATFTGFVSGEVNPSAGNRLYALYPYREDAGFDGGAVTTVLPEEQTAVKGSFDRNANIAMAVSDSRNLQFKNVCGGLRFTLTHPGIRRIVFESNGGEYIAGVFSARFEGGVPVVTEVKDGSRTVTLKTEDGSAFETGVWYYMSFLPVTLAEGYTVTFITDTQSATLEVNKAQTVKRGTYGTVHDIDKSLEWKELEQYDYVIATDFVDWDSACFGRNGELIMLKDCSGEESTGRTYMLLPSEANGLDEFYASFDKNDVPEMVYINGMSIKVLSIQDGLADVLVNFGDTLNVLIDSLAVPFDEARTKSFSENNGVRNACAIAKLVIGVIEVGGGAVLVTASGASLPASGLAGIAGIYSGTTTVASGCLDVMGAYTSLFAPASQTYDGSLSNPIISAGININNQAFDYYISAIADEEKTEILNRSLDAGKLKTANSILAWLSNGIDWIDSIFGRTITERDRALMKYIGFSVITGVLKDKGVSWATVSAYVGPDPYSCCLHWECGIILNGSDGSHDHYDYPADGYFEYTFRDLKRGTSYVYMTYFYDKDNSIAIFGEPKSFDTGNCPDENHVHAIDLGLSVKWACCNVGASKPEEYGGYYAWGETAEKSYYDWDTYRWGSDFDELSKYCTDSYYGTIDGRTILESGDDVAHVKWGGSWRMPTIAEFDELIDNCTSEWTTLNGVEGRKFTSRKNGNSIFLPAAGFRDYDYLRGAGFEGLYWSSSLGTYYPYNAYFMYFDDSGIVHTSYDCGYRWSGLSVRPVSE